MPDQTAGAGKPYGGSFLLQPGHPGFTPEDFTPEHRDVARATGEFWRKEAEPVLEAIQLQDFGALLKLLRAAAELGLVSTLVPERYGGMEMDLVSSLLVTEGVAGDGSYAMCHGAQAGIGALPVLLFGTEEQKAKYLPRLSSAELIAAYCLSESQSGSDALNVRTRAELSPDRSHYLLNGQKMWITGGSIADLFTVFANVPAQDDSPGGFTAFLVERGWDGVQPGAEEHKMGLKGSSTTALYFDNVRVPVANVLGEVGRGHIVALNVLNIGRLKIGASAHGKCKMLLAESIAYAKGREAFGQPIASFGLIQEKLAQMAARIYVNQSMTYRVAGMIEARLGQDGFASLNWDDRVAPQTLMKAVEEFAAESSLVKIFASEAMGFVADEAVQIHGGYGYHADYAVERAYRDVRIYRIFEGTNEINRLAAVTMLLKRARNSRLPMAEAVKGLDPTPTGDPVEDAKTVALLLFGAAYEAFGSEIEKQQEVTARLADVLTDIFGMESAGQRAMKLAKPPAAQEQAADLTALFTEAAIARIEQAARQVLIACCTDDDLEKRLHQISALLRRPPLDAIATQRRIAERLISAGQYTL